MTASRPQRFHLFERWQRLPINLKLLLPILVGFIITVLSFTVLVAPSLDSFLRDNIRLGYNAHVDGIAQRLGAFLEDTQSTLKDLSEGQEVRTLARAIDNNDRDAIAAAATQTSAFFVRVLSLSDLPFANVRYLAPDGLQITVVKRVLPTATTGVPEAGYNLKTEAELPFFRRLQALKQGEIYVSDPAAVPPIGATTPDPTDLEIEVGMGVYYFDTLVGYIAFNLRPREVFVDTLEPSQYDALTFDTYLLDTNDKPFVVSVDELAEGVRTLGDPEVIFSELEEEVLDSPEELLFDFDDATYLTVTLRHDQGGGFLNANWRLILRRDVSEGAFLNSNQVATDAVVRVSLLFVGLLLLITFASQALVRPLRAVAQAAERITAGDLNARVPVRSKDEIGALGTALNEMAARLGEIIGSLEARVAERTRNIEIAAQIGRDAAQTRSINDLLQHTVNAIRDRFNFYHAQVFLVDEVSENAVLVVSTGEAGRILLERKHKLAVGSMSIVGQTTARRRPFITLDTVQSEVPHRFNPVLPLTRSEMALPLQVGDTIIGCLDVQSTEPNAFGPTDVQIFQLLCDQLAIAIDNARLLEEQNERVAQIADLNRQLTRGAWEAYVQKSGGDAIGFTYDLLSVHPMNPAKGTSNGGTNGGANGGANGGTNGVPPLPAKLPAGQGGQSGPGAGPVVEAPIQVRGEVVGNLAVQESPELPLTSEDKAMIRAVAERVALAIENVRLVEQTQSEAQRNRVLADAAQSAAQIGIDFETGVTNLIRSVAASAGFDRWWFGQVTLSVRGIALRTVASAGTALTNLKAINVEHDRSTITETARTGELVIVNEPGKHPLLKFEAAAAFGKHIVAPVRTGSSVSGVLMLGRPHDQPDVSEGDKQLVLALSGQIAVAMENRRLFDAAQRERETLQTVLNSLPTGVVVVDAATGQPALTNEQARQLLGLNELEPYQLLHTGTGTAYDTGDLPPLRVLRTQEPVVAEDITVIDSFGNRTDLLVNAVPVFQNERLFSAVAVYQDVTELRELENVLQESLRETTTLYEVSRSIASENELTGILGVLAKQIFNTFTPDHFFVIFTDEVTGTYAPIYVAQVSPEDGLRIIQLEDGAENCPVPPAVLLPDESYIDSDITGNPQLNSDRRLMALGVLSLNVFPLRARNRAIGWLVIGFNRRRSFAPEERRTLGNMADQAAVAAESARLAEQTQVALNTTTMLYENSLNISRTESIEQTLRVLCERLALFAPDHIDVLLSNSRSQDQNAYWVISWDTDAPLELRLNNAPAFNDQTLIDAPPSFIEEVAHASAETRRMASRAPNWGQFTAIASVPMSVKGRSTGRIQLSYTYEREFTRGEQQIITTLADQCAVSIDNFALVQQTQDTLDETAILYQASRAIANAPDLDEVLAAIVDYAAPSFLTGAMLIRLMTPRWDTPDATVEVAASWSRDGQGADTSGLRFTPDQFSMWAELSVEHPLWLPNVYNRGDGTPAVADLSIYEAFGWHALVVFPLMSSGVPIGALVLGADQHWERSERDIRVYSSLTDLLAISIERRSLLEQTERRARQLQLSAQIAQSVTSILDLRELFERVVNLIKEGFGFDHVQIFRLTEDGKTARVTASTGEAGRQLLAVGHSLSVGSRSVIGQVTATGMPQIVGDTTDTRAVHRPNPYLPDTRAEMALALRARNRILGALDVQSNQPGAFTRDDVTVLSTLADQIAIAIDNAELFATSNQRAEEMRFLFSATTIATSALSADESGLESVARLMCDNLGAAAAAVMLLDDTRGRLIPHAAAMPGVEMTMPPHYDFKSGFFKSFSDGREPMIVNDVQAVTNMTNTTPYLTTARLLRQLQGLLPNAGSLVLVPLLSGQNFLGMLAAAKHERNGFSDDTLRLLQALSSTLSAVVQNARLLSEVQAANIRLLELDRVKSQFLANMSHELRTPLNSIIGFSRVMLKGIDGPLSEMQEQDLSTIYEAGKHLLGLVNDILDQAKIEADKMDFNVTGFSMVELVKGVASTAVGLLKDKPVRLHQEVEANLPNTWGDEFRTRQALLNLVSNAAKFTQQGSITLSAFQIEEDGKPFVQVSVTDTGIGIPEEKLEAIFEPFQQVENTAARQYEGTGLGLPIARKLINKQGGRMWVISELGVGSTFSFTLPIRREDVPIEDKPEEQAG